MECVQIALIHIDDCASLLAFETENQTWFEQHVPPRDEAFYSIKGVREQVQEFLLYHRAGLMYPMLIKTADGEICGRINVNVKESTPTVAEIGYRIGYRYIKQGIAFTALKKLLTLLVENSSVVEVRAHAATLNIGSRKVLERNGFHPTKKISAYAHINHADIDVIEYRKILR
ncbi:GNAT family N-acetyltransferase [Vibrio sp. 10N.286.49.B1]|uniref:GNAT family N-acetyltransferase n=1 Tax=unclassified Vibrio TaxID=2614977 RepID=UPI000C81EF72|nr:MULTISPECIES: GNAT family N-acetyltransferase [unclassified Vibrio]